MSARGLLFAAGLVALVVSSACARDDIVLGTVPDGASTVNAAIGAPCAKNPDCGAGEFCNRGDCTHLTGLCEAIPKSCSHEKEDKDERDVCGCDDGVTYFNDCLRKFYGITGAATGPCGSRGPPCGGENDPDCPTGAVCALLGEDTDGSACRAPVGRCWVVPGSCSSIEDRSDHWNACDPSGEQCVRTCDAVRLVNNKPLVRAPGDKCPP